MSFCWWFAAITPPSSWVFIEGETQMPGPWVTLGSTGEIKYKWKYFSSPSLLCKVFDLTFSVGGNFGYFYLRD